MDAKQPHIKKNLSITNLLNVVRRSFNDINDTVSRKSIHSLPDCLMSALAMFGLKYPSLLQFDKKSRTDVHVQENLKNLYGVDQTAADTTMRERLDPVDPFLLQKPINQIISLTQRGKQLEAFQGYDGAYFVSIDATGHFSSPTVHCEFCCEKQHKDGTTTYYHQTLAAVLVNPNLSQVLPLAIEPIVRQDGNRKNDCEHNAAKRLLRKLRTFHPHLKIIVLLDALYADATIIRLLKELKMQFIIRAKETDLKYLFEFYRASKKENTSEVRNERECRHEYVNQLPLNAANHDIEVNVLSYTEQYERKSLAEYHVEFAAQKPGNLSSFEQNTYLFVKEPHEKWQLHLINKLKEKDRIKAIKLTRMKEIQSVLPKKNSEQLSAEEIAEITKTIETFHSERRTRRGKFVNECHVEFQSEKPKIITGFKPNTYLFVNKKHGRKDWRLYVINNQEEDRMLSLEIEKFDGLKDILQNKSSENLSSQEQEAVNKVMQSYHCDKKSFAWITDIKLNEKNVKQIEQGGRARWKVENETFNTLKNQDYQFEHNYGHGEKNLSNVLAFLMFLAFLIDQVQELSCKAFQAALKKCGSRTALWQSMRELFFGYIIDQWESIYFIIVHGMQKPKIADVIKQQFNTS